MGDLIMHLLKDRPTMLASLFKHLSQLHKYNEGYKKVLRDWPSYGPANREKQLLVALKINQKLCQVVMELCVIAIVYGSSSTFSGDAATIMTKLGRGEEALKAMFEEKFR
jgi:hypothetical protein